MILKKTVLFVTKAVCFFSVVISISLACTPGNQYVTVDCRHGYSRIGHFTNTTSLECLGRGNHAKTIMVYTCNHKGTSYTDHAYNPND